MNMVPIDDPVAVDTMQVARKVNATNHPPLIPIELASQTNPPESPHILINWENMPTSSNIMTTETEVMDDTPRIAESQNCE